MPVLVILLICSAAAALYFFVQFRKASVLSDSVKSQAATIVHNPEVQSPESIWIREKEELLSEKQKFEEKNKKLWQMSETVHKQRRQVEEQNEILVVEKEKLSAEKKKLDEKVKKL